MTEDEATAQILELQKRLADASEAIKAISDELHEAEGWLRAFDPVIRPNHWSDKARAENAPSAELLARYERFVGGEW